MPANSLTYIRRLLSPLHMGRELGSCIRLHSKKGKAGYNRYRVNINHIDANLLEQLEPIDNVHQLTISVYSKKELSSMAGALGALLERWGPRLELLDISTPIPDRFFEYPDILTESFQCMESLSNLTSGGIAWRDDQLSGFQNNQSLREVRISTTDTLTGKGLMFFSACNSLRYIEIFGAHISRSYAKKFCSVRSEITVVIDNVVWSSTRLT